MIIQLINSFGYFAIFFLIAVENIFPPIPSEVILTFSGFATTYTDLNIWASLFASILGSMFGAIVLYFVGNFLDKKKLKKLLSGKVGKILRLKPSDVDKANKWFDQKGNKTVFFCRFIPVVRSLISIPAGMNKMRLSKFLIYTALGTIIWNTVLMLLGKYMGSNWSKISSFISEFSHYLLVSIVACIVFWIIKCYIRNKKNIIN